MPTREPRHIPQCPLADCPTCGAPGDGVIHLIGDVVLADYLCAAGHIWRTSWTGAGL